MPDCILHLKSPCKILDKLYYVLNHLKTLCNINQQILCYNSLLNNGIAIIFPNYQ